MAAALVVIKDKEEGFLEDLIQIWHAFLAEAFAIESFEILKLLAQRFLVNRILVLFEFTNPKLDVVVEEECWWNVLGPQLHDFVEQWLTSLVQEVVALRIQD